MLNNEVRNAISTNTLATTHKISTNSKNMALFFQKIFRYCELANPRRKTKTYNHEKTSQLDASRWLVVFTNLKIYAAKIKPVFVPNFLYLTIWIHLRSSESKVWEHEPSPLTLPTFLPPLNAATITGTCVELPCTANRLVVAQSGRWDSLFPSMANINTSPSEVILVIFPPSLMPWAWENNGARINIANIHIFFM